MPFVREPRKKAGFFLWWRQLPKEVQSEKDVETEIQAVLWRAIEDRRSVSILYRTEADVEGHPLLIYPRQMYKRSGHLYVEGHCYPSNRYQTVRVDRILKASIVGRSTPSGAQRPRKSRPLLILKIVLFVVLVVWLLRMIGR